MLERLDVHADDCFDIDVQRSDDEVASVRLVISPTESEQVVVTIGRFYDDAERLVSELENALKQARDLVETWKDVPDETDGFVFDTRDGYFAQLDGTPNPDGRTSDGRVRFMRGFPTRDIATYELARMMCDAGYFPNAWYQDERGWNEDIADDVVAYQVADVANGTMIMRPLPGVEYAQSQDVTADGMSAYIVEDYGTLGIVYVLSGDDERRYTDDRSTIVADPDEDE